MLLKFEQSHNGLPVWINPRFVVRVFVAGDDLTDVNLPDDMSVTVKGSAEEVAMKLAAAQAMESSR